ncbi:hypothetical protein C488_09664 [Natrinema pellirubrum DSM 15624]|uniref:PGF-CTERM sorting domain-containing protein n=1 Tax=Natrinema pellirubrum (strain DSM 15624 / CIP 106293 / JCM 10476 / NCIMB 786 / 157) TaxID=797303 RepID=L0JRA7_NATP1|nr:hypothetical protein [Natrinema pellirubrum]AGB32906.1 hypothetical protein Natpe_3114 [Natrinema pellirubrum DSM 15624]ELY75666.1 hypothetical protein C488_09664 [Natrinema pellirubrum DSM 15624]
MAADDTVATSSSDRADTAASAPRQRWWRRPAVALVVVLAMGAALVPAAGVTAAANGGTAPAVATADQSVSAGSIVVSDATVEPDGTAVHRIVLTDAPDGLAGFELSLELSGDAAAVENASYPDDYRMTTDPVVSDDGETVTVEAVDLDDAVTPGASDVTLATVTVSGTEPGTAALAVTDARLDADGGSRMEPSLETGTVTVADGGNGSESAGGSDDGENTEAAANDGDDETGTDGEPTSTDSESIPGFAGGAALLALAVLAVTLLARTR